MKKTPKLHKVYTQDQRLIAVGDWSKHLESLKREGFIVISAIYL